MTNVPVETQPLNYATDYTPQPSPFHGLHHEPIYDPQVTIAWNALCDFIRAIGKKDEASATNASPFAKVGNSPTTPLNTIPTSHFGGEYHPKGNAMADETLNETFGNWWEVAEKMDAFYRDATGELTKAHYLPIARKWKALLLAVGRDEDPPANINTVKVRLTAIFAETKPTTPAVALKLIQDFIASHKPADVPLPAPSHWKLDAKKLAYFWAQVNPVFDKYGFSTDHKDREAYAHDTLEVEHLDETKLDEKQAADAVTQALDALYAADYHAKIANAVSEVWKTIMDEFKTIRPDITDKVEAIKMVQGSMGILDKEGMTKLVEEAGKEKAIERWNEKKSNLVKLPEQSKPSNNGNGAKPPEQPADVKANGVKPAEPEPLSASSETVIMPAKLEIVREVSFTGRALLPTEPEWRNMCEQAQTGYKSGLLPSIKNEFAARFIVETGRELGIPPSLALRKINLIHGQPSLAAELMWAMVLNSGKCTDFSIEEAEDHCTVMVKRGDNKSYTTTFNLDMARKIMTKEYDDNNKPKSISLADKYNWKQMPGVMCKWRAISAACRTVFPDVTLGLYSREEMEDNIDFSADPDQVKQAVNA